MSSLFSTPHFLQSKGRLLNISQPIVMGILNATPDSFYNKGVNKRKEELLITAKKMVEDGATILDVGGASSRPRSAAVPLQEELNRTIPVIELLRKSFPEVWISIDTWRAEVAKQGVQAGADIVNDISAGKLDKQLLTTVAQLRVPYVLMHMQGEPKTMQNDPVYNHVTHDILRSLIKKIEELHHLGIDDIIVDPGFGFGKTLEHNFQLLSELSSFKILSKPILTGISRKKMIGELLNCAPQESLNGTSIVHILALQNGSKILRVHDVREAVECLKIYKKYSEASRAAC